MTSISQGFRASAPRFSAVVIQTPEGLNSKEIVQKIQQNMEGVKITGMSFRVKSGYQDDPNKTWVELGTRSTITVQETLDYLLRKLEKDLGHLNGLFKQPAARPNFKPRTPQDDLAPGVYEKYEATEVTSFQTALKNAAEKAFTLIQQEAPSRTPLFKFIKEVPRSDADNPFNQNIFGNRR